MVRTTSQNQARGTARLRLINTRLVLTTLRGVGGPVQLTELARMTSLTRPTVAQIVAGLEERGRLQRYEPTAAAGRPAVRYGLAQDAAAVFGADAGRHRAVVEIASLDATIRARQERRHSHPLGDTLLALLGEMLRECLAEAGLAPGAVVAGTMASPGIVEQPSGRITLRPGLGDWDGTRIGSALGPHIGGAVTVENDANLAARAMCAVSGMPRTFLSLQWGQRLGAGVVVDGQVYRGPSGAAGELGALVVPDPATGELGLLEEVVRASRLPLVGGVPRVSTEELVARAEAGDEPSAGALRRGVDPLAAAVAPICLSLDLRTVTISGAIARSGPALIRAFQDRLDAHGAVDVDCLLSPFHEDTVLRGAVGNAVDAGWEWLLADADQVVAAPGRAR
ncbi:ROK family transcriptional regulator [Jiangella endophytica]|uniref:ROK family transcriptional regulator n=1 Tax=Jiangella endophytica TaxID=1623398 RepID=UPI000E3541BB|nr:ROK family protein [Jiangella endophytica]